MSTNTLNLVTIGNPLLDITAVVEDQAIMEKYGLENSNAIMANEEQLALYDELVNNFEVEYSAGGAGQNSTRMCQWVLGEPGHTAYIGCIGDDKYGKILNEQATADGVETLYRVDPEVATGTCAVLVVDKDRSLVANISAANHYKIEHLQEEKQQEAIKNAGVYYVSSFFLTVSPESVVSVGEHAAKENKILAMNLAAPFLMQIFNDRVLQCVPYMDYVFANEHEAAAFAEAQGWEEEKTDLKACALKLAAMDKINTERPRVVVFTQGGEPAIIASEGKVTEYEVIPCPKEDIVDLNGAGDAYVGGFLAGLLRQESVEQCVACANYVANVVIQQRNATFPKECTWSWDKKE